jgi:hypothetical protein
MNTVASFGANSVTNSHPPLTHADSLLQDSLNAAGLLPGQSWTPIVIMIAMGVVCIVAIMLMMRSVDKQFPDDFFREILDKEGVKDAEEYATIAKPPVRARVQRVARQIRDRLDSVQREETQLIDMLSILAKRREES